MRRIIALAVVGFLASGCGSSRTEGRSVAAKAKEADGRTAEEVHGPVRSVRQYDVLLGAGASNTRVLVKTVDFDRLGHVLKKVEYDGAKPQKTTTWVYDDRGRPTTNEEVDASGNVASVTDTRWVYHGTSPLAEEQVTTSDMVMGRKTGDTSHMSSKTRATIEYDPAGHPVRRKVVGTATFDGHSTPNNGEVDYKYDRAGNLIGESQPGGKYASHSAWAYDASGRVTSRRITMSPAGGIGSSYVQVTTYTYDPSGFPGSYTRTSPTGTERTHCSQYRLDSHASWIERTVERHTEVPSGSPPTSSNRTDGKWTEYREIAYYAE